MDNKQSQFFNRGQKVFWLLIVAVFFVSILHLSDRLFDGKNIPDIISNMENPKVNTPEIIQDTIEKKEELFLNWEWKDFEGKKHNIKFSYGANYLNKSQKNRENSYDYEPLYQHDKRLLKDLIDNMKKDIKDQELGYMESINYVCSSIQYIPYTLILTSGGIEYPLKSGKYIKCPCQTNFGYYLNDCNANRNADGCCNDVDPFGVYAPFEFVYKKTGDCDTRSLLAFTILKEMGFDVAVMTSEKQWHSVLGVYLPNKSGCSVGRNNFGKKYVLWELTSPFWRLGMQVEGNDWIAALE